LNRQDGADIGYSISYASAANGR